MSDKNKSNSPSRERIIKENGRGLPISGTSTPMPSVKPPKPPGGSSKKS